MANSADDIVVAVYSIATNDEIANEPVCKLTLSEDLTDGVVSGLAVITSKALVNGEIYCKSSVQGSIGREVFGPNATIRLSLQGYPYNWPRTHVVGPVGLVLVPNFEAHITLNESGTEGIAAFSFFNVISGKTVTNKNWPVKLL